MDPCTLDITNDENYGIDKDPSLCLQDTFFLWDEPDTQCDRGHGSCGDDWASRQWKAYVDKWETQLQISRARGMKVTTPLMRSGELGQLLRRFKDFFTHCPECNQQGSKYYVDVLAFNAFAVNTQPGQAPGPPIDDQLNYIKLLSRMITGTYPGRPLYATNFGLLKAHTAAAQADVLTSHGILETATSNIDKVFYFAATDVCGGSDCTTKNFLENVVETGASAGKTLGQVMLEACLATQ